MKKLDLSPLMALERLTGFTIPRRGTFYVASHDAVRCVRLGDTLRIECTDLDPYEFVDPNTDFLGLVFDGLKENKPLLRVGSSEISCEFSARDQLVIVTYTVSGRQGEIEFQGWLGDWFAASLSDDGRYLIMADPDNIVGYELS